MIVLNTNKIGNNWERSLHLWSPYSRVKCKMQNFKDEELVYSLQNMGLLWNIIEEETI